MRRLQFLTLYNRKHVITGGIDGGVEHVSGRFVQE